MRIYERFREEDWKRIERDWTAWWEGILERPLVMIESQDPSENAILSDARTVSERVGLITGSSLDSSLDVVLDHYQRVLEATMFYGDAWPKWFPNVGPCIVAAFLGADIYCNEKTSWYSSTGEIDIADLQFSYDEENIWWQRIRALTKGAIDRWGSSVSVGFPDLCGSLDILASFRSTINLSMDLYDAADEVKRNLRDITQLWIRYYNGLHAIIKKAERGTTPWASIWSPKRCYMLQCDFSYMISPRMFEEFVIPDLEECLESLDHAFYHLDGAGQLNHLDILMSLDRLKGIQWIPGYGNREPEEWPEVLNRIHNAGKLCQLYVTAEGALKIVRELGGRGFAFYIWDRMSHEEAESFLKEFETESSGH